MAVIALFLIGTHRNFWFNQLNKIISNNNNPIKLYIQSEAIKDGAAYCSIINALI